MFDACAGDGHAAGADELENGSLSRQLFVKGGDVLGASGLLDYREGGVDLNQLGVILADNGRDLRVIREDSGNDLIERYLLHEYLTVGVVLALQYIDLFFNLCGNLGNTFAVGHSGNGIAVYAGD
ncbi:MAG: hypothetical protein BWY95_02674 [Bacteroidetes bacterium ADurb.BinA104]|nr:MAG: hypothetical protein BWY95_02674 [Bacteroidetes bacterium ADurb.BinA104]